jgi:hypothetical protein
MVFRDIGYPQSARLGDKFQDPVSLMPASLIHPELYHRFFIAAEDGRHAKKSIGISVLLHDSASARGPPSQDIEFMMLTWSLRMAESLCPHLPSLGKANPDSSENSSILLPLFLDG